MSMDRLQEPSSSGSAQASETSPLLAAAMESSTRDDVARAVLRKIDRTIIPLLFVTYMFNFMDKVILSSAAVFGLRDDNNLVGQQYSWVSSIFYLGYLVWTYPTSILITRLPTAKYLAANTVFWGAVVTLTAACTSFGGLMAVRALLGVAEATITPGFMFLTSTWYTRDEMPTRVGMWFAGNSIGGLVSSLLAFGMGHISPENEVGPWRTMYIVLGLMTFVWAVPIILLLPDTISKARFLTEDERRVAAERVVTHGTGSTEGVRYRVDQVVECLIDPKTWFIFATELISQIPNSGTQSFANIIIQSFGFSSLETTLINIPYSLLAAGFIVGSGWLAGGYRTLNCLLIVAVVIPPVVGAAVIYSRENVPRAGQLVAYFFLSSGPAVMPLNMALVQSNYRGVTKRMTMTAMLFLAYCAGNLSGPHFFRDSEAPTYETAFRTILVCYALVMVLAVAHRFYLQWLNKKRESEEGFEGSAGDAGAVGKTAEVLDGRPVGEEVQEVREDAFEDVTDWKTPGFRYRL